jgi:hypothetical protein
MRKCPTVSQTVPRGVPRWVRSRATTVPRPTYKEWWDMGQTVVKEPYAAHAPWPGQMAGTKTMPEKPTLAHAALPPGELSRKGRCEAGKPAAGRSGDAPEPNRIVLNEEAIVSAGSKYSELQALESIGCTLGAPEVCYGAR